MRLKLLENGSCGVDSAAQFFAVLGSRRSSDSQQTPALPEIDPHGVCVEVKGSARVRPEGIGCRRQEGEDRRREGSFSPFLSRPASRRKAAVSLPGDDAALFPPFSPVACMQREKDSFFDVPQERTVLPEAQIPERQLRAARGDSASPEGMPVLAKHKRSPPSAVAREEGETASDEEELRSATPVLLQKRMRFSPASSLWRAVSRAFLPPSFRPWKDRERAWWTRTANSGCVSSDAHGSRKRQRSRRIAVTCHCRQFDIYEALTDFWCSPWKADRA
ncbi:hypothetical protein TGMAS_300300 [Toxoplasma gondii MAS]|uniref:Uncharacterized protein n=1 Tax=Toxoplasma gondii MAS TaxID=943118 RepID=A0A086PVD1_TOXGO|nr:hypothetical protein TGMAS_300300 [Toxoplasma gondii MAS]